MHIWSSQVMCIFLDFWFSSYCFSLEEYYIESACLSRQLARRGVNNQTPNDDETWLSSVLIGVLVLSVPAFFSAVWDIPLIQLLYFFLFLVLFLLPTVNYQNLLTYRFSFGSEIFLYTNSLFQADVYINFMSAKSPSFLGIQDQNTQRFH